MSRFIQIAASAALLASALPLASARDVSPSSSGFLLLASDDFGPKMPSASNPRVSHSAEYSHDFDGLHPGRSTQLEYEVEHSDSVLLVDTNDKIVSALCTEDSVSLWFGQPEDAAAFAVSVTEGTTILTGHCTSADGTYGDEGEEVMFSRQVDNMTAVGTTLTLGTTHADATAVFKHANVKFSTNSYAMFADDNNHCTIVDILGKKCSAVVNETKSWDDLFHFDYSGHTIWSGSVGSNPTVDAAITCTSCFAKLSPELIFNLQITDNKLVNTELMIQGNFDSAIQATVTANGAFSQANAAIPVYTIEVPDVVFYIGAFPVHIRFSVPIVASYSVEVNAQASATAGIQVHGEMGAGFGYDSGKFGPRMSENYGYTVVQPSGSANGNAVVKVGLAPSFRLSLDMIGSGQADVAPYLEFDVEASTERATKLGGINAQGQLFAGVDVDVQGAIGITFKGHNIGPHESFGPKDVYSIRKQIWSGAYPAPAAVAQKMRTVQKIVRA